MSKETYCLEDVMKGTETISPQGTPYFFIEAAVAQSEPESVELCERFCRLFPPHSARVGQQVYVPHATAERTLFLDIETTGLSPSRPLFLIGTMCYENGELIARQYFARTYAEEVGVLAAISDQMKDVHLLVTFNGNSFDVPYMQTRANGNGIVWNEPHGHLDLLPFARQAYRWRLPNCQLQTLESHICNRHREDDIPGRQIPAAYRDFLLTGNAGMIGKIMEHNWQDTLTMVSLISHLFG
ncbi:MAG: ribonuclease H-like domain-containing protein [bacterium]